MMLLFLSLFSFAEPAKLDLLVKLKPGTSLESVFESQNQRLHFEKLDQQWMRLQLPKNKNSWLESLKADPAVEFIQPNYPVRLLENYQLEDPLRRAVMARLGAKQRRLLRSPPKPDNLPIPAPPTNQQGPDPEFGKQWGMIDIGVQDAWKVTIGNPELVVAVIDTGVDYTHEDLLPNLWRNPGETGLDSQGRDKSTNGVDDDGNGFVDDGIGWDFVSNDNKPYDLSVDQFDLLAGGGNPGHGTHCAGNVAARGGNALGIAGVAPQVKIMPLRFLSEKGQGTTADAIKSIRYAMNNGAKIMSNSWGSEGEDPAQGEENKALRDIIQEAEDRGILFIAAAGNGHRGKGYDNDTDAAPSYPASYPHDIIISVAALDKTDQLGYFSNWGRQSVDLGAPGVAVFSTTVGSHYSDKVIDVAGFEVTWDGTSMATPHVAGAAALYWSAHPEKSWQEVKRAILESTKKINSLSNRSVSGGKLDVRALLR